MVEFFNHSRCAHWRAFLLLSVYGLLTILFTGAVQAQSLLLPNDRIIFVGDSITGQGGNNAEGFVHQMEWALRQVRPESNPTLIPLGGSGQSVASWQSVESGSREKEAFLDVRGIGVKATLDQPADVVIIMLGMNDILAPYVSARAEDLDAWAERYRALITAIRMRVKPRVLALATVTLCTEDPDSPRNRIRNGLNQRVAELARTEHAVLLATGQEMLDLLQKGRSYGPEFHTVRDCVHPNLAGHVSIAMGMLKGLGEPVAAQKIAEKYLPTLWKDAAGTLPALSWSLTPSAAPLDTATQTFQLRYWWTGSLTGTTPAPRVRVRAPDGWKVTPEFSNTATGVFTLTGNPNCLSNKFTLEGNDGENLKRVTVAFPAPWLLGAGVSNGSAWNAGKFDPVGGALPWDGELAKGTGLGLAQAAPGGQKLLWMRHVASANFTGGADPASLDFVAASAGAVFEVGYAARWVYSAKERPVQLPLGSQAFAGNIGLTVWVNGEQRYAGLITGEPGKRSTVDAQLHAGWNLLLVKCNHLTWLWQVSVGLVGVNGDDLADVRYAATTTMPPAQP